MRNMLKSKSFWMSMVISFLVTSLLTWASPVSASDEPLELNFDRPELVIENPHDVSSPGLVGVFAMGVLLLGAARLTRKNTGE